MVQIMNKGQWLDDLLDELEWTPARLSRESGLDSAVISNIKNGKRNTGIDVARKIAKATKLPESDIMRRAGILPPAKEKEILIERILHEMEDLSPEDKADVIEFIEFKARRKRKSNHKVQ